MIDVPVPMRRLFVFLIARLRLWDYFDGFAYLEILHYIIVTGVMMRLSELPALSKLLSQGLIQMDRGAGSPTSETVGSGHIT